MKIRVLTSSTLAVAFSMLATGAHAQSGTGDDQSDEIVQAETTPAETAPTQPANAPIIVTAQKRSESINDVPITITAVSGDALTAAGVTDTESLARVVPGFVATNTYFGTPVYYLRGVGYLDTAIAARPAVALYADEIPLPFAATALGSTLDLERVEVLKGPQGTFFGSNATGGAINFIAAAPTDNFAAGADISYGRFDELIMSGFLSGPLGDNVRARVAASRETADEWQRSYTVPDRENGATEITSGRLIIEADPTDTFSLRFTASGTTDRSDTIAPQLVGRDPTVVPQLPAFVSYPFAPLDNARAADWSDIFPDGNTLQRDDWAWQLSLRADWEASQNVTLTSLSAFTRAGLDRGYDADGTTLNVTNLSVSGTVRSIFQELRAVIDVGDSIQAVIGANYQNDESDELVTFFLPDGRNGLLFGAFGLPPADFVPEIAFQESDSWAIFGNVDFQLTDTLSAALGVRYTDTATDFSGCAQAAGNLSYSTAIGGLLGVTGLQSGDCATFTLQPDGSYVAGLVSNSLAEDNLSWRIGLDWEPNPGTLLYASVSRGYKAGAFSNISAVFAEQYDPVPQEELTAYEIGAKVDVTPAFHVNAALFYYDYVDKQQQGTVIVPVFNTLTALVTIPESHVQGFEMDFQATPADGLVIQGGLTYVDTEVDGSFIGNTVFGPSVEFAGSSFPNTPKFQANIGYTYIFPVSNSIEAFFGSNLIYRGSSYSDFIRDDRLYVEDYTLLDAQVGIANPDQGWRFTLWGRNLTNEVYTNQIVRRQEALVRTVGMPRTYGLRFSYRY